MALLITLHNNRHSRADVPDEEGSSKDQKGEVEGVAVVA